MTGKRLPKLNPREVEVVLLKHGFAFVSQKGSHRKYRKNELVLIVPFHSGDLPSGTLNSIIKASQLPREAFE